VAEQPDIIEQGDSGLSHASPRRGGPRRGVPRWAAVTAVAALLIGTAVILAVRPGGGGSALPDPCTLLPAATPANLVPAATGVPAELTNRTTTAEMCTWRTTGGAELSLDVQYLPSEDLARQEFGDMPDATGPVLAVAIKSVPGVGDQAQAVIDTGTPGQVAVYLRILSGSTVLAIGYNSPRTNIMQDPGDETVLAELVPASQAALSRLATTPLPRPSAGVSS
jgi:hypothetical protein